MYKKTQVYLLVLSLLTFYITGCGTGKEEKVEVEPVRVAVSKVQKGEIARQVKATGTVKPASSVGVVAKTGGKVAQVKVKVGDRVKAGQVLVQLDSSEILAQIKAAEAGLALSQAGQKQAVIHYNDTKDNLNRMEYLYKEGAISQGQLDAARSQYEIAKANYNPGSDSSMTQAQINQAKAQLNTLQVNLNNMTITAPVSGLVSARMIEPGEMASPGAPMLTIVDNDSMIVEAGLAESEVGLVSVGQEVEVVVKAAGNKVYKGKVTIVSPDIDQRTKNYPITIQLNGNGNDEKLKGGMLAEVSFVSDINTDILVIPKVAVVERGDERFVYVIKKDKAEKRDIEAGIGDKENVQIISGLKENEQVVIAGQNLISDGSPVKVQDGE